MVKNTIITGLISLTLTALVSCSVNNEKKEVVSNKLMADNTTYNNWEDLLDKDLSQWDVWIGIPHTSIEDLPEGTYTAEDVTKPGTPMGLNNDPKQIFKVIEKNGEKVLAITGEIYGGLTSKKEYENYHLKMQFKWGDKKWAPRLERKRDSGLLFHCKGEQGKFWNVWKVCHELQIQETDIGDYIPLAGPASKIRIKSIDGVERYDPSAPLLLSKGYKNARFELDAPHGQWNTVELIAFKDKAIFKVNNEVVMVIEDSVNRKGESLTNGELQIQSEGAELYYRDMKIKKISTLPKGYDMLFAQ